MPETLLGIYGSPRKGGNTDRLLDEVLRGAREAGAQVDTVVVRALRMGGCIACGGCDRTGVCALSDDMTSVYPQLDRAAIIVLATPIYFYGPPAQTKALIDRCQAHYCRRMLRKSEEERRHFDAGRGYLLAVGATRGKRIFEGTELMARYFFEALDMRYEGGLLFRGLDGKDALEDTPQPLEEALQFGRNLLCGPAQG